MFPSPFLITASRRRRQSLILLSMKRCEFLPLSDYRSLQFFHRLELSLEVDSLLKSTPNSVIHGINIRATWRPHVRFNEVDVLFFRIVHRCPGGVRWRSILLQCPPVMTSYCFDVSQQTLLEYIAVLWAVKYSLQNRWRPPLSRDTPTDTITLRLKCSRSRISTDISSSVCFAR